MCTVRLRASNFPSGRPKQPWQLSWSLQLRRRGTLKEPLRQLRLPAQDAGRQISSVRVVQLLSATRLLAWDCRALASPLGKLRHASPAQAIPGAHECLESSPEHRTAGLRPLFKVRNFLCSSARAWLDVLGTL